MGRHACRLHDSIKWVVKRIIVHQLGSYADSSLADVGPARKSTYSYLLMLSNAAVSWRGALSTILQRYCRC